MQTKTAQLLVCIVVSEEEEEELEAIAQQRHVEHRIESKKAVDLKKMFVSIFDWIEMIKICFCSGFRSDFARRRSSNFASRLLFG